MRVSLREMRLRSALAVAALLAGVALSIVATWLVSIRTNPRPNEVHSLGVVARFWEKGDTRLNRLPPVRYGANSGLRVDMLVHVHPTLLGCGKARVDVVISGTRRFWRQHDELDRGTTQVALGWDPKTVISPPETASGRKARILTVLNADSQAPLHPAFYLEGDPEFRHFPPVHQYVDRERNSELQQLGVAADVHAWGRERGNRAGYKKPIHFRFTTDSWLERRAFGSCYVNLPTLPANGAIGGQVNAVKTLYRGKRRRFIALTGAQPPAIGRTVLDVDGEVSLGDATPAPDDFAAVLFARSGTPQERSTATIYGNDSKAGPVWTCRPAQTLSYLSGFGTKAVPPERSFSGNACGAVAVVSAPRADDLRGFAVLVLGILIGFFFDLFRRGVVRVLKGAPADRVEGSGPERT
jgi:hypothetical protein